MPAPGILILEKNRLEQLLLKERLLDLGFAPEHLAVVKSLQELEGTDWTAHPPGFIFLDLFLEDSAGINTFLIVQRRFAGVPIVVLSDLRDKASAMQCIHLGAQDFLVKGEFSNQSLDKTIRFATERNTYRLELELLKADSDNLFRKNPVPMWVFDLETRRFLWVNEAAVNKYGYQEVEFIGLTVDEIHPPEDLPRLHEVLASATPGDRMESRGVWRHVKKDGGLIQVEIFSAPVWFQGRVAAIGSSVDVTEKLLAEENERKTRQALETQNRQMTGILESLQDCFVMLDRDWRVLYWNRAAELLYGIPREEALGRSAWDIFPTARGIVGEAYQRVMHNQKTEYFEYFSPLTGRYLALSVYPMEDGISVFIKDLTEERQRMQEALETRNNYQALIDHSADDIWSIDRDLKLIAGNRSFLARMKEISGQEIKSGDSILVSGAPAEDLAKWRDRYEGALAGEALRMHDTVRLNNGDLILVEVHLNPIRDTSGTVIGVACQAHQMRREE